LSLSEHPDEMLYFLSLPLCYLHGRELRGENHGVLLSFLHSLFTYICPNHMEPYNLRYPNDKGLTFQGVFGFYFSVYPFQDVNFSISASEISSPVCCSIQTHCPFGLISRNT